MFKANVGEVDGNVRLIAGVVLLVIAFLASGTVQILLAVVSFVLIMTSAVRFCPLYTILGKNTCETK